jgi:hypothetical protein
MLGDRYVGDCVCTRLEDGRVRVERADPTIHIGIELLQSKDVRSFVVEGDLVMIGDENPVMYRITERGSYVVEAVRVD